MNIQKCESMIAVFIAISLKEMFIKSQIYVRVWLLIFSAFLITFKKILGTRYSRIF